MTHDLDPRGLEAARKACDDLLLSHDISDKDMADIITAYLAASAPEGEPDRIAVLAAADGWSGAAVVHDGETVDWLDMEATMVKHGSQGPFARAIVECRLPRPSEPVVVKGRAT